MVKIHPRPSKDRWRQLDISGHFQGSLEPFWRSKNITLSLQKINKDDETNHKTKTFSVSKKRSAVVSTAYLRHVRVLPCTANKQCHHECDLILFIFFLCRACCTYLINRVQCPMHTVKKWTRSILINNTPHFLIIIYIQN